MSSVRNTALDLDGLLVDFEGGYLEYFDLDRTPPTNWNDPRFRVQERWDELHSNKDFWLGLRPLCHPSVWSFTPIGYITARSIPSEWTKEWLYENSFPKAPVISVGLGNSKVTAAKELGVEIFVDDHYDNYQELNAAGIFTYLMDAPHNQKYDVGHKRIFNLNEIVK